MAEVMNCKIQGITETMSKMNEKLDEKFTAMIEAIHLLATGGVGIASSSERNSPSPSQILQQPPTGNPHPSTTFPDCPRLRNQNFNHNPYAAITRLSRLDFPRFNGDGVKDWLLNCEQFFVIDRTPAEIKVNLASIHLDDEAAHWHQSVLFSEDSKVVLGDWNTYKTLLLERFGEIIDNPIAELNNLHETDGIMSYHCKFEVIRNRVQLPESYLVGAYLAGLRYDTQMHVRMFQPHTIRQCLTVAKLYEAAHSRMGTTAVTSTFPCSKMSYSAQKRDGHVFPKPLEPATGVQSENVPEPQQTMKLLPTEEDEDEELMVDVSAGFENEEVVLEGDKVSINDVSGVDGYSTMREKGMYDKKPLFILSDSRSTHNFVAQSMETRLGCTMSPLKSTRVAVADENTLQVSATIKEFELGFPIVPFNTDLMAIQNTEFSKSVFHTATRSHTICPQGVFQYAPGVSDEVWCLETPPWPPDVRKLLIMIAKLYKQAQLVDEKHHKDWKFEGSVSWCLKHKCKSSFVWIIGYLLHINMDLKDHVSWNTMLSGLVQNGMYSDVLSSFQDIVNSGFKPDQVSVLSVTMATGRLGKLLYGKEVHTYALKHGFCSDLQVGNTLLDMYAKCSSVVYMSWICEAMDVKDLVMRTTHIAGYVQNSCNLKAIESFKEAHTGVTDIDTLMISSVLVACTELKLVSYVKQVHAHITRHGVSDLMLQNTILDTSHETSSIESEFYMMTSVHHLIAKSSKCSFAASSVEYLGHFISAVGVSIDPTMLKVVEHWPLTDLHKKVVDKDRELRCILILFFSLPRPPEILTFEP